MSKEFIEWISEMKECINEFGYYVDFDKVYNNVDKIKVELCIFNSLVGSRNIKEEFESLISKYPEIIKCIPILLAVRAKQIYAQENGIGKYFNFDTRYEMEIPEVYSYFMEKTGLFELISNRIVANLVDYVLGVETGLDSNARKNRGGHQMENLVESYIEKTGVEYYKEMYLHDIEKKWGVDLSPISSKGTTTKRWDFVVKTDGTIYLIETNFYSSGGSKLNETSRSYELISKESNEINEVEFVWITDGAGWNSAKKNLNQTFNTMEHIYNIKDLENGAFNRLFSNMK